MPKNTKINEKIKKFPSKAAISGENATILQKQEANSGEKVVYLYQTRQERDRQIKAYCEQGCYLIPIPPEKWKPSKGNEKMAGYNRPYDKESNPKGYSKDPSYLCQFPDNYNFGLYHEASGTAAVDFDNFIIAEIFLAMVNHPVSHLLRNSENLQIDGGKDNRKKLIFKFPANTNLVRFKKEVLTIGKGKDGVVLELRSGRCYDVVVGTHPDTGQPLLPNKPDYNITPVTEGLADLWGNFTSTKEQFDYVFNGKVPKIDKQYENSRNKDAKIPRNGRSPILKKNSEATWDELFLGKGYSKEGERYRRPGSTSGKAGIVIYKNFEDGVERCMSYGGDDLNDAKPHDKFDVFLKLYHDGEMNKALAWSPEITAYNRTLHIYHNNDVFEEDVRTVLKAEPDRLLEFLKATDKGVIRKDQWNADLICEFSDLLRGRLRRDDFAQIDEYYDGGKWIELRNEHLKQIHRDINGKYVDFGINKMEQSISLACHENAYNSVTGYFESLPLWDGIPRLETLIIRHLHAEDDTDGLNREFTKRWFLGAMTRAFQPGCQFDYMLVLEGAQNLGKTSFLNEMFTFNGKSYYLSLKSVNDEKKLLEQIQPFLCVDLSELSALKKSEAEHLKAIIDERSTRMRKAYGRITESFLHNHVFAGTTNKTNYLKDETGNRRYLNIPLKPPEGYFLDVSKLRAEKEQLWAEVFTLFCSGESQFIDKNYFEAAKARQKQATITPMILDKISNWLEEPAYSYRYKDNDQYRLLEFEGHIGIDTSTLSIREKRERQDHDKKYLKRRDKVHREEIAESCLGLDIAKMTYKQESEIELCMSHLSDTWEKRTHMYFGKRYGKVQGKASGWIRKGVDLLD